MKAIGNLIKKIYSAEDTQKKLDEKTLFFVFRKIIQKEFGQVGSEKFIPQHYSKKTISVKSKSAPWAAELWANQGRLIRKVNEELGMEALEKINIR